ncbi:autophagocytosis associated domain-containing protein [Rhizoctonia solani AG-1 IA]|uniref:Autophagy-related protein 3 n=1 Tax=Thanatephorus cucumeris (strain AG1-IA) TaxID=983506 RepID=L8WX14_THACA|nr:autophagocytosis associated domain-containing protein [Rhizoctonia solani AG-1 IA]
MLPFISSKKALLSWLGLSPHAALARMHPGFANSGSNESRRGPADSKAMTCHVGYSNFDIRGNRTANVTSDRLNYGGGEQSRSQTRQGSKEELGLVGLVEPTEVRPVNVTAELPPMVCRMEESPSHFTNHTTRTKAFIGIPASSVFVMPLLTRYPQHRQNMMRAGAVLCVAAMIGAAFSTRVWHLLLTQGILYSIGGMVPRAANGLIFSGTGLGGVVLPFVVEKLLIAYGLRTTLIALAIGYALLLSAALPFVKGRLPPSSLIIPQQRSDWSFLRNPEFIVLFAGNFLQGLGNFVPGIWLPTAAVPGSIAIGFASDRYDLRIVMLTSMLGSSLSVLILWGLASNLVMPDISAISFSALWTKFASTLSQDNPQTIARLMSIFVAGRGVGNVLAAPISTGLLRSALVNGKHAYGLKNYGPSCLGDIGVLCGSKYAQKRPSPVATPAPPHALQSTIIAMNSLHTIQVLKESKFKEHGRITPGTHAPVAHRGWANSIIEEFVAAGDFLTYKFPVWSWEKGDASKARDYLPADKQYLVTRKVPCLRRATSLAYTDADEDAEKLLSFAEDSGKGDEWVQTHAGEIHDIPDIDGNTNELTKDMNALSVEQDAPDFDDIPDMEEEGLEAADEATAKPTPAAPIEVAKGNLLQNGTPLTPPQVFQDVSADHAFKTVTIESFPHISSLSAASVHPCKHADVMKKVIERMNAGVVEEQKKRQGTTSSSKGGKRKWLGLRKGSSATPAPEEPKKGSTLGPGGEEGAEEAEGMRVDFYLVVFLKFIASIVPTIEVDSTTAF